MDKFKKALMIVAIVAIVVIAGSLIYYFVFFRPGIEKEQISLQEQKAQSSKVTVETIKAETEVDKFKEEVKDFINFISNYSNIKKKYEDEWLDIRSERHTAEEIIGVTNDESNAIKGILVFPESATKYIDYDLSYIEIRGTIFANLSLVPNNGVVDNYYPDFSQDLDTMSKYEDQRDNELRTILIDYNNRAKELGLPAPFPNK